jgi:hypothetical protein
MIIETAGLRFPFPPELLASRIHLDLIDLDDLLLGIAR